MVANDYPTVLNASPVDADEWFNPVAQDLTAAKTQLRTAPVGALSRGSRPSNSSTTTSEAGVLRVPAATLVPGQLYIVKVSPAALASTVANDVVGMKIRYTTDGTTPTTSSPTLGEVQDRVDNTTFPPVLGMDLPYPASGADQLSLLLTVYRATGSGSASLLVINTIDIVLTSAGGDPGDTGVDL